MKFSLPDAELLYEPDFFSIAEADDLFFRLVTETPWRHDRVRVFGKWYDQPRLTAFYGDPGKQLSYSGLTMEALPWTGLLSDICNKITSFYPSDYNCVLLNQYRDGRDSNGWHADDETYLGRNPVIASVSLGASRMFHLRHNTLDIPVEKIQLKHGSLLIMAGTTQHFWKHQIPKTARPVGPRINLTFRLVY